MKVLVACEYSGRVREAFRSKGHDVWSCDLEPAMDNSPYHIQGDVVPLLSQEWDLIIAHPPCTYLCNSGVRWLYEREGRWEQMREGAEFFKLFLNANTPKIAIENPVMHKYAVEIVGRKHDFSVQPYEHGEFFTKRTCFWTKNLPIILPTNNVKNTGQPIVAAVHNAAPSKDRWKIRSTTYQSIANAMAHFWG